MYAAVVKFDALTNSVRTAAENHNLLVARYRVLVLTVVGGVVVGAVLCSGYMYALPGLIYAKTDASVSDIILGNTKNLA